MEISPENWETAKELFQAAQELTPEEIPAFLNQECKDPTLRAAVERLLASDRKAGNFLLSPALLRLGMEPDHVSEQFQTGELLAGRFQIIRFIAAGGMGEVYEAQDIELKAGRAIKIIRPEILNQPNAVARFLREVRLAQQVTHPNVCRVFDIFRHKSEVSGANDLWVVSMELLRGETLADRLRDSERMSLREALPLVGQMASALAAAHHAGIVHRDFKPGNVMLVASQDDPTGRAVVTDFGLAVREVSSTETTSLVAGNELFGSPAYMAPEQIENSLATPAADIYALGLVIYEMVTGTRPFEGDTPISIAAKRLSQDAPSPRIFRPELPSQWETVILRCLEREPARRFTKVEEIADALSAQHAPMPIASTVVPTDEPPMTPVGLTPIGQTRPEPHGSIASVPESGSARILEMAHVLFMDIVAYSRVPMDQQEAMLHRLQKMVRGNTEFKKADAAKQLISLPTRDGMALVFFSDVEAPVRCAFELSRTLKQWPEFQVRMGLHSGPVYRVEDINSNRKVAGGGINIAERVMDCGDGGHILVSKTVADVLNQVSTWNSCLHDLGETEVKHGLRIHLYNLYTEDAGNLKMPQKLRTTQTAGISIRFPSDRKKLLLGVAATMIAALTVGGFYLRSRQNTPLTEKDTIVIADFANSTGDAVFDDTLKQALSVALNQSPFLNVLPENKVAATLKLMSRPTGTKLTPEVARELCQRAGSKAYLAGSIASLGSQYVLGLKAVNCQSGDPLAEKQVTAASKEKVLDALGEAASKLRTELGESLATVQKFDVPLAEATTSSLEALKAYSLGRKAQNEKGQAAALPYHQRAIELDPSFAMGYEAVGNDYYGLVELGRASQYFTKAYQLREHASEREKLAITANYYRAVTGELDKAAQTYQEEIESYPQDFRAYSSLGIAYCSQGQYEKATEITEQGLRLAPDQRSFYGNLANYTLALQRFDEARQFIHEAQARKLDNDVLHNALYGIAFLGADSAAMAEQQQWYAGKPDYENEGLGLASDTEAYGGHLGTARELTKRAVDSAIRADNKEAGAIWQANAALLQAAYGNAAEARQSAAEALKLVPTSQGVEVEAALAFAMAGETARADSLAQDLGKRFPLDTQMQSLWLPAIWAQLALGKKNPAPALNALQAASPIELGEIQFVINNSCLYHLYVRGEAYLAAGQGSAAAAEFQKILDHSGIVWNCWTGALAHLGVARANALQARTSQGSDADAARVRALAAYKDFLTLWKDADPDIPILKEAKVEYAKLQ